jgi:hypothetical protein
MRKPSIIKPAVVDVPADNPVGTMRRFTDGLRIVMSAKKLPPKPVRGRRRHKNGKAG